MDSVAIGSAELSAFQSIACDLQPLLQLTHELAFHSHHEKAWFTRSLVATHPEWLDFLLEEPQEDIASLAVLLDRFFRCYYVRPGTPNAQLNTKAFSAIRKRDRAPVFHFLLVATKQQRAQFRTAIQAMPSGEDSRMEKMVHIANQDLKSVSHTLKQQCRGDGVVERIDPKDERGKSIGCGFTVQKGLCVIVCKQASCSACGSVPTGKYTRTRSHSSVLNLRFSVCDAPTMYMQQTCSMGCINIQYTYKTCTAHQTRRSDSE